jgi:hypothetical protein
LVGQGESIPEAVEQDPRGSTNVGTPLTTPEKPQSSVQSNTDVPALPLERLRSG